MAMCALNLVMHVHKQLANVLWSSQGWICSKNVIVLLVLYKKIAKENIYLPSNDIVYKFIYDI